jgi:hypothetical protein
MCKFQNIHDLKNKQLGKLEIYMADKNSFMVDAKYRFDQI